MLHLQDKYSVLFNKTVRKKMNNPERQQKYLIQTEQIYASIGRFAVKFEHVCQAMHSVVMNILQQHGLRDQRPRNFFSVKSSD